MEDEIDLVKLLSQIYSKRIFVLKFTFFAFFLGLTIALLSPLKYKSYSEFIVQSSSQGSNNSISSLAALAGVNLNSDSSGDIPSVLYPNIINSLNFKKKVLDINLNNSGFTYREYLLLNQNSFIEVLKKYTIGLPSLIFKNSFKRQDDNEINNNLFALSQEDYGLSKQIEKNINVIVNEREGSIILNAFDKNPKYSAVLANESIKLLQDFITEYKTENATRVLEYVSEQYNLKEKQYIEIQNELAEFKDKNKNISTSVFESNLQRLETKYNLIYQVYLELGKQLEMAKLQVNKDIPNISIIEEVYIPIEKDSPKRSLIILIYTFLGFLLSVGWVLVEKPFYLILKEIKS